MDTCVKCGSPLSGNQEMWCSESCRSKAKRLGYKRGNSPVVTVPFSVDDMKDTLADYGYSVVERRQFESKKIEYEPEVTELTKVKLGLVADPHMCSLWQQPTAVHDFYSWAYDRGTTLFVCAGDVTDGDKMRKGHEHEVHISGADAQRDYVVDTYPSLPDCKTIMFDGNHDFGHFKTSGTNMVRNICKERPDLVYGGGYEEYENADYLPQKAPEVSKAFALFGVDFLMEHPSDIPAKFSNTKAENTVRNLPPEARPQILIQGHYHRPFYHPNFQGVAIIQLPGFQGRTTFFKSKRIYPIIGGALLELWVSPERLERMRVEFRFYDEEFNDF